MAAATTSTEAPVAPAPSSSATGEQGRFELRALDLRVASNEDVKEACDAFARGFYRPPSAGRRGATPPPLQRPLPPPPPPPPMPTSTPAATATPPCPNLASHHHLLHHLSLSLSEPVAVSDAALAPLATAKFEAIEERFMAESPGASSNAKDDAPRLPAVLLTVRDTSTQKLVGCCTVVGCVKVRDTSGSRLLSGREAESYIVEAQAEAKAMLESGRTKGREGKAPARQRRGAEGEGGANAMAAEGRELGEAGGEGVPSVTKALATIAAGGLVRPRQVALLSDLTVLPEARRNGLAKRMCVECRQQSVGWGFEELILLVNEANGEARSLYRSNGFVEEGTKSPGFEEYAARSEGGGDVVMEKRAVTNLLMSQWLRGQVRAARPAPHALRPAPYTTHQTHPPNRKQLTHPPPS